MASNFFTNLEKLVVSQSDDLNDAASVLTSLGVPSASIAALTSSGIITHVIANASSPADPNTLYQACSISKPICGLAVLRTVDQGKLGMDDPISKHLPSRYIDAISTKSTRALLDHVTVRHLLTHKAGTTVSGFTGYDPTSTLPSLETILSGGVSSNTPQVRVNRFPGLKWRYSGGGTTIVQAILESIHNKPLPEIVKELVFQPLEMTRSCYSLGPGEYNYAQCWDTGVSETKPARFHIQPELGAAGVWTTPTDLLKAARGIRDAADGRSDFLSKELAITGLSPVEGANRWSSGGWQTEKGWFGHGGSNNPGFRCEVMATWDGAEGGEKLGNAKEEGIAIMSNSAMGTELCHRLILAIAYLRGWPGREVVALEEGNKQAIPLVDVRAKIDDAWREWKGKWTVVAEEGDSSSKSDQLVEIVEDEQGGPHVKFGKMPSMRLLKAATPTIKFGRDGKNGIDLVVEGMDMMVALGFNDEGKRSMEIWPGSYEDVMKCEQV